MMKRFLYLVLCLLLTACATQSVSASMLTPVNASPTSAASPSPISTSTSKPVSTSTPAKSITPSSTPLDPAAWKSWPIIPTVDASVRKIYEYGQSLGNDPHSFSIFGDCQSRPDEFMGVFETNPDVVANLPLELRETVRNFRGSFNRESPTAQDGTTP